MTEASPQSEIINGVYPLRVYLGGGDHSAVFLTECGAQLVPKAAIKLVPAERVSSEAQLSDWMTAAALPHPHLIRLLDAGHCQHEGRPFLFVVMEYAEQTLAQVLLHRALSPDEVREMLLPTLDALAFLHRQNLVHGQLKPANLMVVDDQLKLSSDTVSPAGEPRAGAIRSSVYDPPEAVNGTLSPAGDIWGLAITMVEALTQRVPEWPDEQSEIAQLPTSLPPTFADTAQRCLRRDPAGRPTATELIAEFKPTPPAPVLAISPAVVREAPQTTPPQSPKQRWLVPSIAGALVLLVAIWAGSRLFQSQPKPSAPSAAAAPTVVLNPEAPLPAPPRPMPRPDSPRSDQPAPVADSSPAVIHKHIPVVPRSARRTIHGRIKVAVLVTVDRSGKVVDAPLEIPGSSRYFARLATDAARKWRFVPPGNQDSRQWLLTFEFSRGGTTARATPRS